MQYVEYIEIMISTVTFCRAVDPDPDLHLSAFILPPGFESRRKFF